VGTIFGVIYAIYAAFLGPVLCVLAFIWGEYWIAAAVALSFIPFLPDLIGTIAILAAAVYAGVTEQWWFVIGVASWYATVWLPTVASGYFSR
jgi:hypothetical protein